MQAKIMTVNGIINSNLEIRSTPDGAQYATSLIAIDCGNNRLEHICIVFTNDMIDFAVKQVVKNIKMSITGNPVIDSRINKYGQVVVLQKIYVTHAKLLTADDGLTEVSQTNFIMVEKPANKNMQMLVLDSNISDLFKGFVLQNSTIRLINQLYSTHGIIHIKALAKDTMERADNYDSYIFKMLSSNAEPKWYAANQAKFISELNIQNKVLKIKQLCKSQYENLVEEYNQYCNNADNLRELTQQLQEMINNRIAYFTNNPQKLVVKIIGLEQYIINMTNRLQKYLTDDYLFFAWLLLNNKSTTEVQNNKLFLGFISDVSKE